MTICTFLICMTIHRKIVDPLDIDANEFESDMRFIQRPIWR